MKKIKKRNQEIAYQRLIYVFVGRFKSTYFRFTT